MKIYMSVDMEGISGISTREHVVRSERLYAEGQRLLTADVNAAVRGAFDGGADEVIVIDAHGASHNILIEQLDPRALLLVGAPCLPRFAFLDEEVDGMFLLGYHAMGGTSEGNLEHTMSSASWHRFNVNGRDWGELAIDATFAAEAGVPVVLVSGDDKLCREARDFLGEAVETACVKQGLGRHRALCLPPARGNQVVYEHARRAVERLKAGEKFPLMELASPNVVTLTYKFTHEADAAAVYGAKRLDGYTIQNTYEHISQMYGGLWKDHGVEQVIH